MNFYTYLYLPQNKGTIIPPSRARALHSEPSQETETHGHALVICLEIYLSVYVAEEKPGKWGSAATDGV